MRQPRLTDAPVPVLAGARRSALALVLLLGLLLAAALAALPFAMTSTTPAGLAVYTAAALLVLDRLPIYHPHARFGLGNGITLARAAAV